MLFRSASVQFTDPQAALNHAMELHRAGRLPEAEQLYRELYRLFPQATDVLHLLGLAEVDSGRAEQGFANLRRAVELQPGTPHYHANLGSRLAEHGLCAEAEACLREALRLQPALASHHYNLGNALLRLHRPAEAVDAYREALRLQPGELQSELQLGLALHAAGRREEARACCREALTRHPGDFGLTTNLGAFLQEAGDLDGAEACFRAALELRPDNALALSNLAVLLKDLGETAESVRLLRRAADRAPESSAVRSNLILVMHYDPATRDEDLRGQHAAWNRQHVPASPAPHANTPDPGRRIRIGFVSPDFRDHVVGRALLPSFARHDRAQFEVFAYSSRPDDALTAEFRRHADVWRTIGDASPEKVAAQIREDRIDILVDLAQHTSDNRLEVFARKPAPVQVSWLGCPESTGLSTMDYRVTDARLEPPGGNRIADPREKAAVLPDSWTCYAPPAGFPEVNALPSDQGAPFTFGSFNNNCKINAAVLSAWARILLATPGSRLRLLSRHGAHRRRLAATLAGFGVDPEHVSFADHLPAGPDVNQGRLLGRYHEIDLALDTFPYGGMTTTLDALWMGVPVVTLVGERSLGRAGLSLLSNVGLAELAAPDVDAYVRLATGLAQDRARLAGLRAGLRQRMQNSPLLDADGFTRKLEAAFRDIWVEWCARAG